MGGKGAREAERLMGETGWEKAGLLRGCRSHGRGDRD